jgi:two-component system response regulator HydG
MTGPTAITKNSRASAGDEPVRILIVDDEPTVREGLAEWFAEEGWRIAMAGDAEEALGILGTERFDLALLDIRLPGMDGLELHRRIRDRAPEILTIFMTAYASVDTAIRAMKEGAYDYIVKPFQPDEFAALIRQALADRVLTRPPRDAGGAGAEIVAVSRAMRELLEIAGTVAQSEAPVVILGESGTGKEMLARTIHARSRRAFFPFVPVNCGAVPPTLMESELFGHEKGAFTGAQFRRKGKVELAGGGTLFLDEIGEIPPPMQVALLRVLETGEITRLGGERSVHVDFRVVVATHADLRAEIGRGRFREDLYYRLNVITLRLPPLRDRREDIPPLAEHFLAGARRATGGREISGFAPSAIERLQSHSWPGNIRELRNVIERAVVLGRGERIEADDLGLTSNQEGPAAGEERIGNDGEASGTLDDIERSTITKVLDDCAGNVSKAAIRLGIDRTTLYRKLKRYGIGNPGQDSDGRADS